jgi:hypothetical protein
MSAKAPGDEQQEQRQQDVPDMGVVVPYEDLFGSREGSRGALVKKLEADVATRGPPDLLEEGKGMGMLMGTERRQNQDEGTTYNIHSRSML